MQCPESITPSVRGFAESLVPGQEPVYIDCEPLAGVDALDCFPIVEDYVAIHGGWRELGWCIYLWPRVWMEAEFHAVWIDDGGIPHDIAPHQVPMQRILFVADPSATYGEVHQINNRMRAIRPDPVIQRYIDACNGIYAEENRGEFAKSRHFIQTPRWHQLHMEKMECQDLLTRWYGPPPGFQD